MTQMRLFAPPVLCNYCGLGHYPEITQTVFIGRVETTLNYCCQDHREKHYLERIRASETTIEENNNETFNIDRAQLRAFGERNSG